MITALLASILFAHHAPQERLVFIDPGFPTASWIGDVQGPQNGKYKDFPCADGDTIFVDSLEAMAFNEPDGWSIVFYDNVGVREIGGIHCGVWAAHGQTVFNCGSQP